MSACSPGIKPKKLGVAYVSIDTMNDIPRRKMGYLGIVLDENVCKYFDEVFPFLFGQAIDGLCAESELRMCHDVFDSYHEV